MKHKRNMTIQLLTLFAFLIIGSQASFAETPAQEISAKITAAESFDRSILDQAGKGLKDFFASRSDLKSTEAAQAILTIKISTINEKKYQVELGFHDANGQEKNRSFKMRNSYNLEPELKRQLEILIPGPKHANSHPNELTPDELKAGYKKIHDKLHKKN